METTLNIKMVIEQEPKRCDWCLKDQLYKDYHDHEWGIPIHDDTQWFEKISLDGAQAGLSWYTILVKRENYRKAYEQWDVKKIASYGDQDFHRLMNNPGIVRNKLKIKASITNAQAFLRVQEEFGTFDQYIWQFTAHKTIVNHPLKLSDVPVTSAVSDVLSKDLKKRGFKFVGSTICYAFMQAAGMVDDHLVSCWRKKDSV
ncbi:DNA-3-methyladenine glycosylase I [Catalinimonas alkaloidigena]|uniref:DNA-3-methyladenine glycosylase I n=1 Tax=Catalinimonas alkaloidigena TaxID=1075417 RepID=UPI00240654F8|nr:DNA-3-methyladenine glycosylase I [Catalinimonas alkaloidigena]MDF9797277.1 DNA-3-methyladenine glycosylase I [Catalinimonas alkaloidigena]